MMHNIVIKGRRPGQTEDFYYNRFTSDNAAIHGSSPDEREGLITRLMEKAMSTVDFWMTYEPEGSVIRIVKEPINQPKKRRKKNG